MTILESWALKWAIPAAALHDLRFALHAADGTPVLTEPGVSEAAVQARVRVAASRAGMRLWRNNVGAFHDAERNVHVRFGLANDSKQVNDVVKSADLIGIRPVTIQQHQVGHTIGQFVSFECKHAGWRWTGSDRERAQEAWAALVTSLGGVARFVTDPEQVLK